MKLKFIVLFAVLCLGAAALVAFYQMYISPMPNFKAHKAEYDAKIALLHSRSSKPVTKIFSEDGWGMSGSSSGTSFILYDEKGDETKRYKNDRCDTVMDLNTNYYYVSITLDGCIYREQ